MYVHNPPYIFFKSQKLTQQASCGLVVRLLAAIDSCGVRKHCSISWCVVCVMCMIGSSVSAEWLSPQFIGVPLMLTTIGVHHRW
jgi:hypothetical protein